MHARTTSYVVRVWLYVLLIVHKFLVGPALPYLSSILCPCRDNVCSKNTVTVLCSNGADGSISCTFTYATELTIFIHEFMYAMVNNKKKTIVTQFKLYLCSVMLKINKLQFSTARPMNKWEWHFFSAVIHYIAARRNGMSGNILRKKIFALLWVFVCLPVVVVVVEVAVVVVLLVVFIVVL